MLIRCNMAISAKKGKSRVIKKVLHYFIFVNIVSKLVPCRGSIELQSKAFTNGAEEELYTSGRPFQESLRYESPSFNSDIFFNPPFMDYGSRPIGMPFVQQIMVHNTNPQLSLHLLSISGSSPHFHCSFFEDKLVAPMGNTTFEICFLAQNLGQIKTTLYIHSSRGSFKYHVSGEGMQNPYRIRPVLGARVPINSSFSPVIHLYNPHGSVLQVQEIYSSGSDLHLELPSGEVEATKDMWEIPPYETKPIMKANFLGRVENNHTAFIRIKTNKESKEEMLVVPMEVEVTSSPGLFSVTEMLDFGILRTFDENTSLKLEVLNSKSQSIYITNVTVEPPNEAVEVDFVPLEVQYDIFNPTGVALVTFQASKAVSLKDCSGHIVLWTADSLQKLQIPYQAQVFFGDLQYNKSLYFYSLENNQPISHNFPVKNLFQHPVVIFNVSLGSQAKGVFSVVNFSRPVLIRPGEELPLLTLMFHPERAELHFNTEMILHTNLSLFSVSVIVYNGKLQVYHDSNYLSGYLNFGTLATGEKRSLNFTVLNNNPIDIMISKFYTNFDGATVELLHIGPKNCQQHGRTIGPCSAHSSCQVLLRSYHEAAFELKVKAPEQEGSYQAEVVMETEDELLLLTFNLQTSVGNILIDSSKLVFHQCFPGKIVWIDLRVNSSFQRELRLQDVTFASNDPRFKFIPRTHHSIIIGPNRESLLGKLYFDLLQGHMQDYYLALSTDAAVGHSWLLTLTLNRSAVEVDILLYLRSRHKFSNLLPSEKISNTTLQLNTDYIKGFLFNLQAHLSWPVLLNQSRVIFPLTQIGSQTSDWFTIENPSNLPLLLHIVPDFMYPDTQQLMASVGSNFVTKDEYSDEDESFQFDTSARGEASNPFIISSILDLDSMKAVPIEPHISGIYPSANTSVILLQPGKRVSVELIFHPKDEDKHSSIFIIRNNLTVIELIRVQGQGGKGDLRLSNRKPGSTKPLSFEMSDKHVKLCEKGSISKGTQPNFSIKRSFTLHNLGQLPVTIHSFEISGRICEGYGFKVLDCTPLTLHANESKKLSILFTPDFSMSKVRQVLILRTHLTTEMEFIMHVNIPSHMISKCASVLPRPLWEPMMFYCIVVLMAFMAICIVTAAYYESNQILSNELHRLRSEQLEGYYDRYKVFDLRLCTSNETPKCINRKVLSQETFGTLSSDTKTMQSGLSAPSPSRLLVGQKPSKSSTSLVSFLSDIYQGLKVSFFSQSNHKKTSMEPKKKIENSKFSFCFWNILKSKNVEKIQNPKKEDLSPTQVRNSLLLQRRADAEGILTLRKNKRQKNFPSTNKPLDILADASEKVFMKNKNEGSRSFKQDARKGLIHEMKLPDKNDDSSSTATDTSSLENDDKNILTEYLQTKRDKTKVTKTSAPTNIINADEHTERTTSHSPKRKLSKEAEDNTKTSRPLPKQEVTKVKTSTNPLRGKRKSNTPYCGSSSQNNARPQSKSPTPAWDSPSTNGDDLSDIVNQTSNFAKLKTASLSTDKQSKCSHPLPSESPEVAASATSNTVKPLRTSTHVAHEAPLPMSSLSNFGGRPVAAVGATIRRPWTQADSPSTDNDINSTFKGSSTSSIQNIASDPFLTSTHLLNNSSASRPDFKAASESKELIHNDYLEPINSFKPPIEKHDAMMQTLLAERRKRLLEYQKKMLISEWSGIGKSATPTQQPWNDYSGYWSSQSCLSNGIGCMSPLTPRYDMFGPSPWSNYKPPEESTWMSPSSLWRSEPLKMGSQDNDSYAIFDPFNTLENNGSIWNPTSTGSNINNGWDMSSSPNKPSDK